ncbi:hypothetical protein QBC37DRAFT_390973 [Rhypophila decipiens]|uniref:Uncharacterized protein n=1 Tax=Rhypophila decipiens TaxID=261697 RepID=A0AAN6XZW9_9PEZI|nr:hypothetical protein QBC37DRAFT_390973 [Rhypophila decipiens]
MEHATQPAHILRLPDEVLLDVVYELVTLVAKRKQRYLIARISDYDTNPSEYAHTALARLARVSRRFHAIASQILYETVNLDYVDQKFKWDHITHYHGKQVGQEVVNKEAGNRPIPAWWRARSGSPPHLLYRTLMESPSLRNHCRTLRLKLKLRFCEDEDPYVAPNPILMQSVVRNMFTWLCNITKLDLYYDDELGNDDVLAAVSKNLVHLQQVRKLMIQDGQHILLPDLYYGIIRKLPNLESLAVQEAGRRRGRIDYADKFPPLQITLPPPSLTSISFHDGFEDDPPNLDWFLRQPLNLVKFTFELRYRDHGDWNAGWSLPTIFSLLRHQARTLRTIDIGILYTGHGGNLETVNLSGFTSLEELTLSYWDIEVDTRTSDGSWTSHLPINEGHAAILSAPKLKRFTLCFDQISRMGSQSLASFGEEQENWLRELVLDAARGQPKASLRHVHLDYRPVPERMKPKGVEVWPWARINRVRDLDEVKRAGIEITYVTPRVTEGKFHGLEVE